MGTAGAGLGTAGAGLGMAGVGVGWRQPAPPRTHAPSKGRTSPPGNVCKQHSCSLSEPQTEHLRGSPGRQCSGDSCQPEPKVSSLCG